jgi:hypothetical protein
MWYVDDGNKQSEILSNGISETKLVQEFWKELEFGWDDREVTLEVEDYSSIKLDAILGLTEYIYHNPLRPLANKGNRLLSSRANCMIWTDLISRTILIWIVSNI